jgi:MFS family permease
MIVAHRWRLSAVFMVTLFVAFLDRLNITYALPLMAIEYGWSESELQQYGSQLMGLFYVAYGFANIFLTPIAAKWGTRRCLLVIICLWSAFTAMGAFVSQFLMLFLMSRLLLGLAEGVHIPMMMTATKLWFPPAERSRANSIVAVGIFAALLLSPFVMVPMMTEFGWRVGFHALAVLGLLISLPLVFLFVHDSPLEDPHIEDDERAYIAEGIASERSEQEGELRWLDAVLLPGFLLLLFAGAANNLIGLGLTSWIPTYFTHSRGIPFEEITWLVAGPSAFSLLGVATWALLGDRLDRRALMTGGCTVVAGVALYFALRSVSLTGVIILISLAVFCLASYQASEFALLQRIVPQDRFASLAGFYNGASIIVGGGLGPALLSSIVGDGEGTWVVSIVAFLCGGLLVALHRKIRY